MLFLKSSIIIMRYDFKSETSFSCVLGYPGLALVGELDVDDTNLPWVLLLMILPLCPALWLSLMLADLSLIEACLPCESVCQYS